jgi:hypothetical protein
MKAEIKIPAPYTSESLILAMQTLKLDPNFSALCSMMRENDIRTMERDLIKGMNHLEGKKLTTEDTEALRYRLDVFEELMQMPDTIIMNMQADRKTKNREEDRADPYHTVADIEGGR